MKTLQLSFILVAALGGSQIINAQVPGAPPERCTAHHSQVNAAPPPPDAPASYAVHEKAMHLRQAPDARQAPEARQAPLVRQAPPPLDPDMKNYRQAPAPPDATAMISIHPPDDFYDR